MRILVVDDEALIRENIRRIIEEPPLQIQEVYTASNAFEAMEIIETKNPGLILSDIRMPSKSGIELAEYVRQNHPEMLVILITGYSDFEYAQAAIKNNVFDYILKPVSADKLITAVLKAKGKLAAEEKHARLYHVFQEFFSTNIDTIKKQYIENLLFRRGSITDADDYKEVFHLNFDTYRLVAIKCTTAMEANQLESEYYCTFLVDKYLQEQLPNLITYSFGNLFFFLWEVKNDDHFADNKELLLLLGNVLSFARKNFLGNISAGISQASNSLGNIQKLRSQTSDCLEYIAETSGTEFVFYDDIMEPNTSQWETEHAVQELTSVMRTGKKYSVLPIFDSIVGEIQEKNKDYILTTFLLIASNISFVMHELELNPAEIADRTNSIITELSKSDGQAGAVIMRNWLSAVCDMISGEFQKRGNNVVNRVCDYINANYNKPIGLAEASRCVERNPSYVSRLVREYTGQSFTQILTDKRITEAKTLLRDTSLKISEISEKVGYINSRYFNRVFRANVNMSANDYRNFAAAFPQ